MHMRLMRAYAYMHVYDVYTWSRLVPTAAFARFASPIAQGPHWPVEHSHLFKQAVKVILDDLVGPHEVPRSQLRNAGHTPVEAKFQAPRPGSADSRFFGIVVYRTNFIVSICRGGCALRRLHPDAPVLCCTHLLLLLHPQTCLIHICLECHPSRLFAHSRAAHLSNGRRTTGSEGSKLHHTTIGRSCQSTTRFGRQRWIGEGCE